MTNTSWKHYETPGLGSDAIILTHIDRHPLDWLKSMSPITTLHNTARLKVEIALLNVTLVSVEVAQFAPTPEKTPDEDETTQHENNSKQQRSNSGNAKSKDFDFNDYSPLVIPAFDLSISIIS